MNDFKNYYKGKKVLVTGADGFMGSHLTEHLVNYGANVIAYVRWSSNASPHQIILKNINHLKDKVKLISGDIASFDIIENIKKEKPEIIFHLAANHRLIVFRKRSRQK